MTRSSYGGKMVTRIVADFDASEVSKQQYTQMMERLKSKQVMVMHLMLQDENKTLGEFEK